MAKTQRVSQKPTAFERFHEQRKWVVPLCIGVRLVNSDRKLGMRYLVAQEATRINALT